MPEDNEHLVGYVNVDSGHIWLGDLDHLDSEDALASARDQASLKKGAIADTGISEPLGISRGMSVPSGSGGGYYPAYVTYGDEGRLASLMVDFKAGSDKAKGWDA